VGDASNAHLHTKNWFTRLAAMPERLGGISPRERRAALGHSDLR
jgi:hypothetical protein